MSLPDVVADDTFQDPTLEIINWVLTHMFPVHPFSTPCKYKTYKTNINKD